MINSSRLGTLEIKKENLIIMFAVCVCTLTCGGQRTIQELVLFHPGNPGIELRS